MATVTKDHPTINWTVFDPQRHATPAKPQRRPETPVESFDDMQDWERRCWKPLLGNLPFASLGVDECQHPAAVNSAFDLSWDRLQLAGTTELFTMIERILETNTEDQTTAKRVDVGALAVQETARLINNAPALPVGRNVIRRAINPVDSLVKGLGQALGTQAKIVIRRYRFALDWLRDCGLIGEIEDGNGFVTFSYAKTVLRDVERDRTEKSSEEIRTENGRVFNRKFRTTTLRSEAEIETTTSLQTHRHTIRYPEWSPVPARHVAKPKHIEELEKYISSVVLPESKYLTGDVIDVSMVEEALGSKKDRVVRITRKTTVERHFNRENLRRAAALFGKGTLAVAALPLLAAGAAAFVIAEDPALVVGGKFVIAGWLPSEVPLSRRYQLQRS